MFEFEELDYQETLLGAISLRRRSEPRLGGKVLYEVKLGEELRKSQSLLTFVRNSPAKSMHFSTWFSVNSIFHPRIVKCD